MSHLTQTHQIFYTQAGLDSRQTEAEVAKALYGADDGELFLEYIQSESLVFDDGRLKSTSFDSSQGFGLRAVKGESFAYAHSAELSIEAIRRAGIVAHSVGSGQQGTLALPPENGLTQLYGVENPLAQISLSDKIDLLHAIDSYARGRDSRVRQVTASLYGEWQAIEIVRADGTRSADIRPLVRLNVAIVAAQGARQESGSAGAGGRRSYALYFTPEQWQGQVDEALRQALVNLDSRPAPAGEMPVVLGSGWPGVMLHEAIGHGLEGDFNRKKTSAFSNLMGQRVASPGVTVVDDGTICERRGSLHIDDEGTPSHDTVLIEDGILVGYMQDRLNARLMGMRPTGNGRRQSYAHHPMPRMTNTYMRPGSYSAEEIIASVPKGIYAVNFNGGQVDITNGKFVFVASEAYLIEQGKIGPAVKGVTLIGNGPDALTRVSMVGNDLALDQGIGMCGKDGQGVPVGVGQPTLRIDGLTVGGTAT
jgi:TldD protein